MLYLVFFLCAFAGTCLFLCPQILWLTENENPPTISPLDIVRLDVKGDSQVVKSSAREAKSFLPLTPAMFQILLALADGERHGYSIMQEVESSTEGKVRLGPGTLYGSVKRMLSDGLIAESGERPDAEFDDERRRYYKLTDLGRGVAVAEAMRLAQLVSVARAKKLLSKTQVES
jgi:DNA-binding PadR family transcriptional regulator